MATIPDRIDSKFRYVLLAAQRAERIMMGAAPKLDLRGAKPCRIAMNEISQDVIDWDYGPEPDPEAAAEVEA